MSERTRALWLIILLWVLYLSWNYVDRMMTNLFTVKGSTYVILHESVHEILIRFPSGSGIRKKFGTLAHSMSSHLNLDAFWAPTNMLVVISQVVRFCWISYKNFMPRADFARSCKICLLLKFSVDSQCSGFKQKQILSFFGLFRRFSKLNGLKSMMPCDENIH